jgi:hypothetical protein
MDRKGRKGRREILSFFASFAASAFNRDASLALEHDGREADEHGAPINAEPSEPAEEPLFPRVPRVLRST